MSMHLFNCCQSKVKVSKHEHNVGFVCLSVFADYLLFLMLGYMSLKCATIFKKNKATFDLSVHRCISIKL